MAVTSWRLPFCCLLAAFTHCAAAGLAGCNLSKPGNAVFREVLEQSRAYYATGVFTMGDAMRVSNLLSERQALLSVCPVAVLQAILLKLEENLVHQHRAYQDMMSQFSLYMQTAIIKQSLTPRDLEDWPLADGIRRTMTVSAALDEGRNLSSAMVMNFCQPEDRFGTVHALTWLLEPPFGEHVEGDAPSGLLLDTDLYIYLVDAPWCKDLDPELVSRLSRVSRRVHLVKYTGGPGREEQTAYFKYIVDHYDHLPDFTIFVHPDAPEHQGPTFPALTRALQAIRTQSVFAHNAIGYYPLAGQMVVDPRRTWGDDFARPYWSFWHRLYGLPWYETGFRAPRCRWDAFGGTYIAGIAPGTNSSGTSLASAKAACLRAGEACAGVTCGTPEENEAETEGHTMWLRFGGEWCSARHGKPAGLHDSPVGEYSFLKVCAEEALESAHTDALRPEDSRDFYASTYSKHIGSFLLGYAREESHVRNAKDTRRRCDQLGKACSGFTCEADGSNCTVREGAELMASPTGEVSFRKKEPHSLPPVPSKSGASEVFQFYTGSQSVVRKDRLLAWSREELAIYMNDGQFCTDHSGSFEAVWHVMFGEPLSQWTREEDPSLPLHLKWLIPTKLSFGDMRVV